MFKLSLILNLIVIIAFGQRFLNESLTKTSSISSKTRLTKNSFPVHKQHLFLHLNWPYLLPFNTNNANNRQLICICPQQQSTGGRTLPLSLALKASLISSNQTFKYSNLSKFIN
jgi:hypothetical protein